MLETASSMVPQLQPHPDDTAIALVALRDRSQEPVAQTSVAYLERTTLWHSLPLGASRGQFLPSPHIAGRLLRCALPCLLFLISSTSRTPARSRLSAWRLITYRH